MQELLYFNPFFRKSASELLKLPVFDSVRQAELEQPADFKINLDEDGPDMFDYF